MTPTGADITAAALTAGLVATPAVTLLGSRLPGSAASAEPPADAERRISELDDRVRKMLLRATGEDARLTAHASDVTALAAALASELGVAEEDIPTITRAALLHDIGKVGIPRAILEKPGPLNSAERRVMESHVEIGADMVASEPGLDGVARVVRASHENWDGSGYPDGLAGEEIPLAARIVSLADAFDAMTTDRPYREGMSVDDACAEVRRCAGTQFDPSAAAALQGLFPISA